MQAAITERDFRLREQNENLIKTKSSVMLQGLTGEIPENVRHFLTRIKKQQRNSRIWLKTISIFKELSRAYSLQKKRR
jgi:hypothetical protein